MQTEELTLEFVSQKSLFGLNVILLFGLLSCYAFQLNDVFPRLCVFCCMLPRITLSCIFRKDVDDFVSLLDTVVRILSLPE